MSERHHARCLLIVRLNNFAAIDGAFGADSAVAAMEHLGDAAGQFLGRVEIDRRAKDEFVVRATYPDMRCAPLAGMVEALCAELCRQPFHHDGADMLLSLSAGFAHERHDRSVDEASGRLARSILPTRVDEGERWAEQYRSDMKAGATLIQSMQRGATFLAWRPIVRADDDDAVLWHEVGLRGLDRCGEQIDCAEGRGALERLGLTHLIERATLSRTLDELERDPVACLSVPVSTQSLSLNLLGESCGWNEVISRLEGNGALARRLIIEMNDHSVIERFRDMVELVRALRRLGVRFAVGRFGCGHASIEQWMTIAPDFVKLEGRFLHTAYQSDTNRRRITRLIKLARVVSPMLIIDGIESPWHLRLAVEEGAEGVAGSHLGLPSRQRGFAVPAAPGVYPLPITGTLEWSRSVQPALAG